MPLTLEMVTIDCADPVTLAQFWTAATGYRIAENHEDQFVLLTPPETASTPRVNVALQRVDEPKATKNRCHLDFGTGDRAADVRLLVDLGAAVVDEQTLPGFSWTVLADPEGNEFCVAQPDDG